jgi:hypothetical protein
MMSLPALPSRRNDMAHKALVLCLGALVAASPLSASVQDPREMSREPEGTSETKYCMHIEAITGSRIEEVKCWTRAEWAERGVDVDEDWAKEGVRTIG